MTEQPNQSGPLLVPLMPPSVEAATAVREKLHGHSTAANWLPEGLWPELDSARAEQLRLRDQVISELSALEALESRCRDEDKQHDRQLLQAQREGRPVSVEDRRTPSDQRQAERAQVEEQLWAGVIVLGEVADAVVALFREREDEWLADLQGQLEPAREKRREAERLLEEAKAEEWQLHQLGQFIQVTSDDGAFGRQPAPEPSPPPKQFSAEVAASMLERPWHKRREHDGAMRSWQEVSDADRPALADPADLPEDEFVDEGLPVGDPTGQVSGLDESFSGARS